MEATPAAAAATAPLAPARAEGIPLQRSPGIDLLRGICCLLVVLLHLRLRIPLQTSGLAGVVPARLLVLLGENGYEAVFVFFVLSGFLIAGNSLRRWGSLGRLDARAFYARRFARIAPLLLLLVAALCVLHWLHAPEYRIKDSQSLGRAVVAALGLHVHWYEAQTGWLPGGWDVLWSLSIEELFYLAVPLACLAVRREWLLGLLLCALGLSLPWARAGLKGIAAEKATLPGLAAIATGVFGALLARHWARPLPVRRAFLALGVAGLLGVGAAADLLYPLVGRGLMLVLTVATLLVLLGLAEPAARTATPPRWWGAPAAWLRWCGRVSYEIYLTHMFAVVAVVRLAKTGIGPGAASVLWYLPAVALAFGLGVATARWISGPSERWVWARASGEHKR
jgi:peptidoglycan/LPS O-acetylase OafA/YrhL